MPTKLIQMAFSIIHLSNSRGGGRLQAMEILQMLAATFQLLDYLFRWCSE